MQRNWDYSKSQHENYKALGLVLSHQTRQQVTKINEEGIGPIVEIVRTCTSGASRSSLAAPCVCSIGLIT